MTMQELRQLPAYRAYIAHNEMDQRRLADLNIKNYGMNHKRTWD